MEHPRRACSVDGDVPPIGSVEVRASWSAGDLQETYAIDAEGSWRFPQVTVAHQLPVAVRMDQPIRVDDAFGEVSCTGGVGQRHPLPALYGSCELGDALPQTAHTAGGG